MGQAAVLTPARHGTASGAAAPLLAPPGRAEHTQCLVPSTRTDNAAVKCRITFFALVQPCTAWCGAPLGQAGRPGSSTA